MSAINLQTSLRYLRAIIVARLKDAPPAELERSVNDTAWLDDGSPFQSIIHFPMPGAAEREAIWRKTMPPQISLADDVDWPAVAASHEVSGANILNICHHCALQVLANDGRALDSATLEAGIMREYVKEGRVV
ncbi:MAG: hypothetical protein ABIQ08_02910 [Duganella sp.]